MALQKSRGPRKSCKGSGNFIVSPPFQFYFNPWIYSVAGYRWAYITVTLTLYPNPNIILLNVVRITSKIWWFLPRPMSFLYTEFCKNRLITLRASCGTVYCNRSCLWCMCVCLCEWVCYNDNSKLRSCDDAHQTGSVGKGSDHLQLIKFWPSRATRKGVCGRAEIFDWLSLTTASAQCLRLFERFFD